MGFSLNWDHFIESRRCYKVAGCAFCSSHQPTTTTTQVARVEVHGDIFNVTSMSPRLISYISILTYDRGTGSLRT